MTQAFLSNIFVCERKIFFGRKEKEIVLGAVSNTDNGEEIQSLSKKQNKLLPLIWKCSLLKTFRRYLKTFYICTHENINPEEEVRSMVQGISL